MLHFCLVFCFLKIWFWLFIIVPWSTLLTQKVVAKPSFYRLLINRLSFETSLKSLIDKETLHQNALCASQSNCDSNPQPWQPHSHLYLTKCYCAYIHWGCLIRDDEFIQVMSVCGEKMLADCNFGIYVQTRSSITACVGSSGLKNLSEGHDSGFLPEWHRKRSLRCTSDANSSSVIWLGADRWAAGKMQPGIELDASSPLSLESSILPNPITVIIIHGLRPSRYLGKIIIESVMKRKQPARHSVSNSV